MGDERTELVQVGEGGSNAKVAELLEVNIDAQRDPAGKLGISHNFRLNIWKLQTSAYVSGTCQKVNTMKIRLNLFQNGGTRPSPCR